MKQPNSNLSEEHALRVVSQSNEEPVATPAQESHPAVQLSSSEVLTAEEARVAVEAIQRINSKLEMENASLRERVELLDQLVVKLLKRNDKLANKP